MAATGLNKRLSDVKPGAGGADVELTPAGGAGVPAGVYWPNVSVLCYGSAADTILVKVYTADTPATLRTVKSRALAVNDDRALWIGNLNPGDRVLINAAATTLAWLAGGQDS